MTSGTTGTAPADRAGYTTRSFTALRHRFQIHTSDAQLGRGLDGLLSCLAPADDDAPRYSIARSHQAGAPVWSIVFVDRLVAVHNRPTIVIQSLFSHINRSAVASTPDRLLIHASAMARRGQVVVVAGRPDAGKSTLAAALLRAGFDYLSDEVAALDVRTGAVGAYPKPLALDRGSWALVPELRPAGPYAEELAGFMSDGWYVNPLQVRRGSVAREGHLRLVVVPRLEAGRPTVARPLARADALRALYENSFNFTTLKSQDFLALSETLGRCEALELIGGDLDEAVAHIRAALDGAHGA